MHRPRLTLDEFIIRAQNIHGTRYEYPGPYKNSMTKMPIVCSTHGKFMQKPNSHLSGSNCPRCSYRNGPSTMEAFVAKATTLHNDKYRYSGSYVNAKTKVTIICPIHGNFQQTPDNHLHGQNCPKCSDYTFGYNIKGIVYIVELQSNREHFIKVGITNTPDRRFREIRNESNCDIIDSILFPFNTGEDAYNVEQELKEINMESYIPLSDTFKGKTECYMISEKQRIITFLTQSTTVE